jgi:NAD(P)-dependent dehydrogenase (short-subunit alcohol dehydrogenase family)|tara:strand:+ start:1153 stop:2016 length:864 start_codon:yes stop_codon:yes gene_type:complete
MTVKMHYNTIDLLEKHEQIFDLTDRVGIVTGGAGKMGREFAKVLSFAGASVVLADIDKEGCQEAADSISKHTGGNVLGLPCDVSSKKNIHNLFSVVESEFGGLDFLVNNVIAKPEGYYQSFDKYKVETWDEVLQTNLTGVFLTCQAAVNLMKRSNGGSIVNTASIYGVVAPDQRVYDKCLPEHNPYGGEHALNIPGVYSASKGGLISFSRYLAVSCAEYNIRVNILTPGGVYDGQEESFHKEYIKRVPLGRMAVWSDYNGAILFLVSDASRYMTGANLKVDGGWTAW